MKSKSWVALGAILLMLVSCALASADASAIRLSRAKASLQVGKSATLKVKVKPAGSPVIWRSENPQVATVNQAGKVTAVSAGSATIIAKSGGVSAQCVVAIKPVKITKVILSASAKNLALSSGSFQLTAQVKPASGDKSTLTWKSSNADVAAVSQSGLVTLKKAGTVKIAAVSPTGVKGTCTLKISGEASQTQAANRRALVIGEGRANSQYRLTALPMVHGEVAEVAQMFKINGIPTTTLVNGTRSGVLSAIQKAFSSAKEDDVSYLYITCHGGISGGSYLMYPCGDGYISAVQLRSALDQVAGKVVLMLGSCQSGTVIGKSDADASEMFIRDFIGATGKSSEFASGKYQVLCACRSTENGYGVVTINGAGQIVEEGTYNFFGRAVQEGGKGAADQNKDGAITMSELYSYVKARVSALHAQWSDKIGLSAANTQTVVAYPASSSFVLFN